jgi:hypothetical protein
MWTVTTRGDLPDGYERRVRVWFWPAWWDVRVAGGSDGVARRDAVAASEE